MLLLTTIAFFTSVSFDVEAKDCSHIKKLHKKLICKSGSDRYDSDTTKAKKEKEKGESFNEKYKTLADFFKKKE